MSRMPDSRLLQVEELSKRFSLKHGLFTRSGPSLTAIDRVSLNIDKGQVYGLVGESGSGKSTLGRAILQLVKPDSGRVLFQGRDLCTAGREVMRRTRQKIQIIFQDPLSALSPRRTVLQSLMEPLDQFGLGERSGRRERCEQVLETVGLDASVLDRVPRQLSSGQRQRVCIARAVLTDPDLIIADEAVSALDVSVQAQVLELIRNLQSRHGIAFMFITHDLAVIPQVADHVGVMYRGRIVESARVESLFDTPSHPYTRQLLAAIPDPDPQAAMTPIQLDAGISREPRSTGCAFADRCPDAVAVCATDEPQDARLESGDAHHVKCHLYSNDRAGNNGNGRQTSSS